MITTLSGLEKEAAVSLASETPSAMIWMRSPEAWVSVWPGWEGGTWKMWSQPEGN